MLDTAVQVVLQSEPLANETLPPSGGDPRKGTALPANLVSEAHACDGMGASLLHRTAVSGLRIGAAMEHHLDAPQLVQLSSQSFPDLGRVTITATLEPRQRLRLVKFVAYGWSAVRSQPAVADQVAAALTAAVQTGWDGLVTARRAYLDRFWGRADVQADGDERVQQAVRFALFHVLHAGARADGRAIAAKGLTGPGYDGHAFWDTETFVLPLLTYTAPRESSRLNVEITPAMTAYRVLDGRPLSLLHDGERATDGTTANPVSVPNQQPPTHPVPTQPRNRTPQPRGKAQTGR